MISVATRTLVNLSTLAAAALLAWYGGQGYAPLDELALATFVTGLVAGRLAPAVATRAILFVVYLSPAAFLLWSGRNHFSFEIAWMAALLGLMLSGRGAWTWNLPTPWRWAIAWWALVVSVTWPIVAGREYDFAWWIGDLPRVSNTSIGIAPAVAATWVVYVVVTHNVGLIWIDWLYARYATDLGSFRREIAWPLASAILVSSVVGLYQALVDYTFLSGHLWPHMQRASGTLMDANAFGMLAAMWGAAVVGLTLPGRRPVALVMATACLAVTLVGVWSSGSRTALFVAGIGALAALHALWTRWQSLSPSHPRLRRRYTIAVVAGATALIAAMSVVALRTPGLTAIERARHLIPGVGSNSLGQSAWLLWDRMGYGAAAVLMVEEHPLTGVGVGAYHTLVHDFATEAGGYQIPPDNAQNWYRHQLAELGVLGSLPWLLWVGLLSRTLLTRRARAAGPDVGLLRVVLLAFGAASFVGMPGQAPAVGITVLAFVHWLNQAGQKAVQQAPLGHQRTLWAVIVLLVGAHAALTFQAATEELRPAHRAARFGWYYRYGLYDLEQASDGAAFRWTMRRAVMVIPVEGRSLLFDAGVSHPDGNPVHVRVWSGAELLADTTLPPGERLRRTIPVTSGQYFLILRTEVDRAFRPIDHGGTDPRELGLAVSDWRWQ